MVQIDQKVIIKVIDWLVFVSVGIVSLCYSVFWSSFAELHIKLSFLNFPIFVGEILLGVCLLLLAARWTIEKIKLKKIHLLLFAFMVWLMIKAAHGYTTFGPLAFRNAALFYYCLFAVISFSVFRRQFFHQAVIWLSLLAIIFINVRFEFHPYFTYPTLGLACVLILRLQRTWQRILMAGVLVFIYPFKNFFLVSKSFIVGNIFSFVFLGGFLVFAFWDINRKYKYLLACLFVLTFALGFLKYAQRSHVSALTSPYKFVERIKKIDSFIQQREQQYTPRPLKVSLYDKDKEGLSARVHQQIHRTISKEDLKKRLGEARSDDAVKERLREFFDGKFVDLLHEEKAIYNVYREHTYVVLKKRINDIEEQNQKIQELDVLMQDVFKDLNDSFVRQKNKLWQEVIVPFEEGAYDAQELGARSFDLLSNMQPYKEAPLKETIALLEQKATEGNPVFGVLHDYFRDYLREYKEKRGDLDLAVMKRDSVIFESDKYLKDVVGSAENVGKEQGTFVFRFLIWRDMFRELWNKKAFLGINFGQPQRSKSLEILELAYASWMRDGWVTPHNSFFNMIYRAGILGIGFVICIFVCFVSMVKKSVQSRSLEGLVLCSIFVYWLTIANFSVFLELPYQAIPFWALMGMTVAYVNSLQESTQRI